MARRSLRGSAGALLIAAGLLLTVAAAAAAPSPRSIVLAAIEKSDRATSVRLSLYEIIAVGSEQDVLSANGIQQPKAKAGSYTISLQAPTGAAVQLSEVYRGVDAWIHYPILTTLHARNPAVRTWIAVGGTSALGVVPEGAWLSTQELTTAGTVTKRYRSESGGEPGFLYSAPLDVAKMLKQAQFAWLLSEFPSGARAFTGSSGSVSFVVGKNGFITAMAIIFQARVEGKTFHMAIDLSASDYNGANAPIAIPPASEVMSLARYDQLVGAAPTAAETSLVRRIALKATQVGKGYTSAMISGGNEVEGQPTLNYCGFTYASESLRLARLQLSYTAKHASFSASNEVVVYRSGGTQEALSEMRTAAARCATGLMKDPPAGVRDWVRAVQTVSDPGLLPGAVALIERDTAIVKGKRTVEVFMLVFQTRGSVLSGVYGYGASVSLVRELTLRAALQSADNLRRDVKVAPKPKPKTNPLAA